MTTDNRDNINCDSRPSIKLRPHILKTTILHITFLSLLLAAAYSTLANYSLDCLYTETSIDQSEWIVLLGGEITQRVAMAAELYHRGAAPKIFVSGGAECLLILQRLKTANIPSSHIFYECQSQSTYENAIYTRKALARYSPKKIILVTSWFHTSRAIGVFRKVWPNIDWQVYGELSRKNIDETRLRLAATTLVLEYVKTAWYKVRYQI